MSAIRRLLLVDADANALKTLEGDLRRRGYQVLCAQSAPEALQLIRTQGPVEVVVTSIDLPGMSGLDLVREVRESWRDTEVIAQTAHPTIEGAIEAIKVGAYYYLVRPFSPEELLFQIEHLEETRGRKGGEPGSRRDPSRRAGGSVGLIGSHPSMLELEGAIENVSRLRTNILIVGESGTGKELVARAIHQRSPWANEPFVGINCGAFTRTLLEDQLFGHVRGAFTGASEDKSGVFIATGRGTLFLDEITELDLDLQGKLLRAIQEREVVPLGSNRPVTWHGRLIAATNKDVEKLVEEGKFRRDLFYRINVVQIRTPPLRERLEDIPALVEHFLEQLGEEHGRPKKISLEALDLLLRYSYPGNIRELRNALERAHALGLSSMIQPGDLPREFQRPAAQEGFKPLEQVEREHILRALRLAGGKKLLAAKFLGIDRNRLNRKIKKYRLAMKDSEGKN